VIDGPAGPPAAREAPAPRPGLRIASAELFRGRREIVIVHRGQEYRLHITKADKLILTK
jgi:hemin uptake protein HemP